MFLDKFQVDYKDPTNFIYYEEDSFKYKDSTFFIIFKLYMKYYNINDIRVSNKNITSFPIYPNMIIFDGENNQLTSFPIQHNMIVFYGENNKLTSFPDQPQMALFSGDGNELTSQPEINSSRMIY